MKVLTVIGARPQFVKAAVVSKALRSLGGAEEVIVHTGQHYDANMSDVFFQELGIAPPESNLGVGSGSHGVQTARMLEGVEAVLQETRPDWLLIYGDTNSTLAGAVAASKLHIRVAHVEAGLRSFNRRMPEEVNRVVADHLSDLLFAPTQTSVANLRDEGIGGPRVHLVGDVMYDAALHFGAVAESKSGVISQHGLSPGDYVLATVHRAENTGDPARLRAIFNGLGAVAREREVVLPLHPRTREALERHDLLRQVTRELTILEPVGYFDMLLLEKHAALVVTDSGGVQKEAFFFGVPCATVRDETEWVELVEAGWNRLVPPTDAERVSTAVRSSIGSTGRPVTPYGNGDAAERIARVLYDS